MNSKKRKLMFAMPYHYGMKICVTAGVLALVCAVSAIAVGKEKNPRFEYYEAVEVLPLNQSPESKLSLWYHTPATHWEEALPVGNGRLGAMVYGGVANERIQLNEDSIWAGPPVPEVK